MAKKIDTVQTHTLPLLVSLGVFLDSSPVPTFVLNTEHQVVHWNKACEKLLARSAESMVGTTSYWQAFYATKRPLLADLVLTGEDDVVAERYFKNNYTTSSSVKDALEATEYFPNLGISGMWLRSTASPLFDAENQLIGVIATIENITKRRDAEYALIQARNDLELLVSVRTQQLEDTNTRLEQDIERREIAENELLRRNKELTELNQKLSMAQQQLMQSEKLAALGQLAAGVAHEINNPVGYIFSNIVSLENYLSDLFLIIDAYEKAAPLFADSPYGETIRKVKAACEFDYLTQDIPELIGQTKEGLERVKKIVQELKEFARSDPNQEWQWADIHQCINSTLNIVNNEIKYKADVIRAFGDIPKIRCLPSQINQVILNLIVNASHAIGNESSERGSITICTRRDDAYIEIDITDTGCGIPAEIMSRIFEPFFTTKSVSQGTGLGLSLSYGIIRKHQGDIQVVSEPGKGTCFTIRLPIDPDISSPDTVVLESKAP